MSTTSSRSQSKLTILDLCPYWSFPPTGGGPQRVYQINRCLSNEFNILQFSARPTFGHQRRGLKGWIGSRSHQITTSYIEYQYFNPITILFGLSLYKVKLHSDIFLSELIRLFQPKRLWQFAKKAHLIQIEHPWLIDLAILLAKGKPITYVAHNVESALWVKMHISGFFSGITQRPFYLEQRAVRQAMILVTMSQADADRLNQLYHLDTDEIKLIIPNGVDVLSYKPASEEEKKALRFHLGFDNRPIIIFTGTDHYPNREAVARIYQWQQTVGSQLNIQFIIVGTAGQGYQSTYYMKNIGYVDDVIPYLRAADIAINPLMIGSGTSLKIVEYLACGLPTITSPVGMRGLDITPGKEALVGEVSEFPGLLEQLLKSPGLQRHLSQNGRKLVETKYSWEVLARPLMQTYRSVLK